MTQADCFHRHKRGTFHLARRKKIFCAFLCMALCATLPRAVFAETTNLSPYHPQAVVDYEEIDDFEVKSFPLRMSHPYEIVIPNTSLGQVIACRIYDAEDTDNPDLPETPGFAELLAERPEGIRVNRHSGSFRETQFVDSQNDRTHIYFAHKISDATFRCFNAYVAQ